MIVDCMRELWLDRWFDQRVYARRLQRNEKRLVVRHGLGRLGYIIVMRIRILDLFSQNTQFVLTKNPARQG